MQVYLVSVAPTEDNITKVLLSMVTSFMPVSRAHFLFLRVDSCKPNTWD